MGIETCDEFNEKLAKEKKVLVFESELKRLISYVNFLEEKYEESSKKTKEILIENKLLKNENTAYKETLKKSLKMMDDIEIKMMKMSKTSKTSKITERDDCPKFEEVSIFEKPKEQPEPEVFKKHYLKFKYILDEKA